MLSIEEIKLLIEKLKKAKKEDFQALIDSNLKILENIASTIDAYNQEEIDRLDKTHAWFNHDRKQKIDNPEVDTLLRHQIKLKIGQFAKTSVYNSLEIGPGNGMFAKEFGAWAQNYFLDITNQVELPIRRQFNRGHQRNIKFYKSR